MIGVLFIHQPEFVGAERGEILGLTTPSFWRINGRTTRLWKGVEDKEHSERRKNCEPCNAALELKLTYRGVRLIDLQQRRQQVTPSVHRLLIG